ncbi:hypothetical protein GH714_030364 [Hevea brasiliensis]|uniref:Uncharacterized protein n=1 Tax=Hevea brasiliensis TaxID=3981 RepID=A0A6A6K9E8_HEVBR|nr:hypothetical protein GH714_030364 [Hevea brasiliensis]
MSLKSAKAIWDYLKAEYEGDDPIKGMQVLNLIRDFELQKMKDSETIKEYSERLLNIANRVRLLGSEFKDSRIVENFLVTVPERFEATITTLENTKDLSNITLVELLNSLQAQEQRRVMREEGFVEEALQAKHEDGGRNKKKKNKKNQKANGEGAIATIARAKQEVRRESILLTKGTEVFVDNQAAIAISYNPVFHGKTKHFNIKLFVLREIYKFQLAQFGKARWHRTSELVEAQIYHGKLSKVHEPRKDLTFQVETGKSQSSDLGQIANPIE